MELEGEYSQELMGAKVGSGVLSVLGEEDGLGRSSSDAPVQYLLPDINMTNSPSNRWYFET